MADVALAREESRTEYQARARYWSSEEAFAKDPAPVPAHKFVAELQRATDPDCPTGFVALDLSGPMQIPGPATTPLILAGYLRLRANERLATDDPSGAEAFYVLSGAGRSATGGDAIDWAEGDLFMLPGGAPIVHEAAADALVYRISNAPGFRFEGARPPAEGEAGRFEAVHYPAAEIEAQIARVHATQSDAAAGKAVIFSSAQLDETRMSTPGLQIAYNTLEPGAVQRRHRHNSVAVTLGLQGEGVYTEIDGTKHPWMPWAVTVTPPAAPHSHVNEGPALMRCLIVQDAGLHFRTRTMGFEYAD